MEALYVVVVLLGLWLVSLGAAWWAGRASLDDRCDLLTHERDVALEEVERLRAQGVSARTAGELALEAARRRAAAPAGPAGLRVLLRRPPAGPVGADSAGGAAGEPERGAGGAADPEVGRADADLDRA